MSDAGLQIKAALVGDFGKEVDRAKKRHLNALAAAVFDYTDETLSKLRQDMAQSGLARSAVLANTWHGRHFVNNRTNPAGLVYSSMPIVVQAFEQGATIKSDHGLYLAVPNPEVWPSGRVQHRRKGGAQSSVAIAEQKFGPLRFVYRPGPVSYLVADVRASTTVAGAFRKASTRASRTGRGLVSVVVFFLVRQVQLQHRLHGDVIRKRARTEMQSRITQLYVKHINSDADSPLLLTGPKE